MAPEGGQRRTPGRGTGLLLGMGDHTLALTLSSLSLVYVPFLIEDVGLRPFLAGLVPWIGRMVDAFTDPVMGRLSDTTRCAGGRRRPYFLLGALPFALSFVLLWARPGSASVATTFALCAGAYVFYSVASTVVSVPYVALLSEVVPGYEQRNTLHAWRSALTLAGTLLGGAVFRPLAIWLGGGQADYLSAAALLAAWLALPWLLIWALVREAPGFQRPPRTPLRRGLRLALRHRSYLALAGLYVCGRIAMDLAAMALVLYFATWLGRPGDFAPAMGLFLLSAALALPLWRRLALRLDKLRVFQLASAWWGLWMLVLFWVTPEAPSRTLTFALISVAAAGYGAVDMLPWSMLADVADEDELASGDRREGLYGGLLTWVRKLGGATGVLIGGAILDVAGYLPGGGAQPESAREAVRSITAIGPALFLAAAVWVGRHYSITRARHAQIRARLEGREAV